MNINSIVFRPSPCDVALPLRKTGISQNYVPACTAGTHCIPEVSAVYGRTQHLTGGLVSLDTTNSANSVFAWVRLSGHEDKDLECCNQIRNCSVTPGHRHLDTWIAPTLSQHRCNGQRTNLLCSGWSRVLWCIINGRTEWNVGEQVCYLIFHCACSKINGRLHWCSAVRLQCRTVPSATGTLTWAIRT
jgi:hypothetical protein